MDHTGGEDSKEKIAAVLAKRALDGPGVEHYESQVESLKHEISSLKVSQTSGWMAVLVPGLAMDSR